MSFDRRGGAGRPRPLERHFGAGHLRGVEGVVVKEEGMKDAWGGLIALGMDIGEERVVDEGTVERLAPSTWRINILGHEALVGAEIASNVLTPLSDEGEA